MTENKSKEELECELNGMKLKYSILLRDFDILTAEKELLKPITETDNSSYYDEIKNLQSENQILRKLIDQFKNKLILVLRNYDLHKHAMNEIRQFLCSGNEEMMNKINFVTEILMEKLAIREQNLEKLKKQNLELCDKNSRIKLDNDDLKNSLSDIKRKFQSLYAEKQQCLIEFEAIKDETSKERNNLLMKIELIETKINQLENEKHALLESASFLKSEFENEKVSLTLINQNLRDQLESMTRKTYDNNCTINDLNREITEMRTQIINQNQTSGSIEYSYNDLRIKYHDLLQHNSILEEELNVLKIQKEKFDKLLHLTADEKGDLQMQLKQIKAKVCQIEMEHKEETERIMKLNDEIKKQCEKAFDEIKLSNKNLKDQQNKIDSLTLELLKKEEEQSLQRTEKETLTNRMKDCNERNMKLNLDIEQRQRMYDNIKNDLINSDLKNNDLKKNIQDLEMKIKDLRDDNNRLHKLLQQNNIEEKQRDIERLQTELTKKIEEIHDLKVTVQKECEERTLLIIAISELKSQLQRPSNLGNLNNSVTTSKGTVDQGTHQSFLPPVHSKMIQSQSCQVANIDVEKENKLNYTKSSPYIHDDHLADDISYTSNHSPDNSFRDKIARKDSHEDQNWITLRTKARKGSKSYRK